MNVFFSDDFNYDKNDLQLLLENSANHLFYKQRIRRLTKNQRLNLNNWPLISKDILAKWLISNKSYQQDNIFELKFRDQNTSSYLYLPLSYNDFQNLVNFEAYHFKLMGMKGGDRVTILQFPPFYEIYLSQSIIKVGATYIALDGSEESQFVQLLERKVNVIFATPYVIGKLIDFIKKNRRTYHLRLVLSAGQKIDQFQMFVDKVKTYLGASLVDSIGSAETGPFAYRHGSETFYRFLDKGLIIETLDTETFKPVSEGEIVITTLWRKDFPLIRYRTGDWVKLETSNSKSRIPRKKKCFRMLGKRSDIMMKIRGNLVSLPKLHELVSRHLNYQYPFDPWLWKWKRKLQVSMIVTARGVEDQLYVCFEKEKIWLTGRRLDKIKKVTADYAGLEPIIVLLPKVSKREAVFKSPWIDLRTKPFIDYGVKEFLTANGIK